MPKPLKQTTPKGSGAHTEDRISDPRFANIQTDPRFKLPSKKNTHVQIDKRFAHMLRDEDFSSRAKVDRYGRKLPKDAGKEQLKRYYRLKDEDQEESEDESEESEEQGPGVVNAKAEDASSSEESSSDEEGLDDAEEEEVFGLLEDQEGENGIPKGEVSSRLAVVNLDWDNIRASDLMAVFSSFIPSSGRIRKISIYPSSFGKERMEREEMDGPPKEIFGSSKTDDVQFDSPESSDEDSDEGQDSKEAEDEQIKKSILKEDQGLEFNSAKLRRYQLERLRYFYAVLDCSSAPVAQAIYDAVDGTEYLTTANFFDLRYIPDDTDFSDDVPRDECERIPDGYKPNEFVTDALQHSKVRLTWDADDGSRKEAQKRAFAGSRADIDENDLKAYLGSDTSEDEDEEAAAVVVDATAESLNGNENNNKEISETRPKASKKDIEREKMRALLGLPSEPEEKKSKAQKTTPVGDMQITFSSGLTSETNKGSVFENEPERDETTVEKYVRKEKERKARRKEKMKDSRNPDNADSNVDSDTEAVTPKPATKKPSEDEAPQDLGFSDPFFTAPSSSTTATTADRKAAKLAKRQEREAEEAASAAKRAELELLMVDDHASSTKGINHFDINEIAKAEKALSKKKKGKKVRLSEREKEALKAKEEDRFSIDVGDERFRDVFERSEFAIDPSHPRFKGTEGMRMLLEEGRRKRKGEEAEGEDGDEERVVKKGKKRKVEHEGEGSDIESLVEKVRRKAGKKEKVGRA